PGIQTFRLAGRGGESLLGHHVEFGIAIGSTLGGNDDNNVGTAHAENCGCGSILEYGNRLYLVGVDGSDIIAGYAVDQDQGAAGVHGSCTAQVEGSVVPTRLSTGRLGGSQT